MKLFFNRSNFGRFRKVLHEVRLRLWAPRFLSALALLSIFVS